MSTMTLRLNRVWRPATTGLCFTLSGLGELLLSTIQFNVLLITVWDKARRRRIVRRSIAASFRLFLTVAKRLGMLDHQIEGRNTLRNKQGCPVVANHPTLIDHVLLASVTPETDYLMKSALLKNLFPGGVVRAADCLINSQADALLPVCQQRLEQGDTILIFLEGTRTRPGEAITLQRDVTNIAMRCSSDLRIVITNCSEQMLDKENQWYNVPSVKPMFIISVYERVKIDQFYDVNSQEPALATRQLNQHLLLQLQLDTLPLSGTSDVSVLP